MNIMRATLVAIATVSLVGCAADPGGSTPSARTDASPAQPSLEPTIEVTTSMKPVPSSATGDALTGILGLQEVEGGCPYLETAEGMRYEVLYPDGWELNRSPLQLVAPDGEAVARAGDEVTVRGSIADDMASICMIGPIFRASEVVSP